MRSFSAKIKRIHRYPKSELEKQRLKGELDDHDVLEAAYDWLRDELSDDEEREASVVAPRDSGFVLVTLRRGTVRLHRAGLGGCWMARARDFRNYLVRAVARAFGIHAPLSALWVQGAEGSSDDSSRVSSRLQTILVRSKQNRRSVCSS